MFTHHFKAIAARAGAVTLLSAGMIVGFAGTPALAQTHTTHSTQTTINYTVLGDSYSAGSGGGGEVGRCAQSPNGYGPWVAAATGATLTNQACSGATTTEVRTMEVPFLAADTNVITLTAGGNDVAWSAAIEACLAPASTAAVCKTAVSNSIYLMTKLPKSVTAMLKAIKAKAPQAKVLYMGYPRLFEPENMAALGYTPTQIAGTRSLNTAADLLNATLALSALSNRVAFVPVAYLFAGHAVPSVDSWLNPPGGPNPFAFHPNALGYRYGYAAALRYFL